MLAVSLLLCATSARATYRGGFFDISKKPTVHFEKNSLTWTLRNQVLERIIHFDTKTGGLSTLSVKNLRTGRSLGIVPGAEGEFVFAAPLHESPIVLAGWKATDRTPPADWNSPGFDDTHWQKVALPAVNTVAGSIASENQTQSAPLVFLRRVIPASLMQAKRNYALLFDHCLDGGAEIYVDGELVRTVTAAEEASRTTIQIDLVPSNRVIALKLTGRLTAPVSIAEEGTAPANISLSSDWKYSVFSVNPGEDNSQVLTLSLSGTGKYEGFVLDVSYQIFAGDEPFLAKWFRFVSHRGGRFLLESARYDGWIAPGAPGDLLPIDGSPRACADIASHSVAVAGVISPQGTVVSQQQGKWIFPVLRPYTVVQTDNAFNLPRSLLAFAPGTEQSGLFLYQLFLGEYGVHGGLGTIPLAYDTGTAYGLNLSAALCNQLIPIAARLGAKAFVLGDGWQRNGRGGEGRFGDWLSSDDKTRFPGGLLAVAEQARTAGMGFGLEVNATRVDSNADGYVNHPDWLFNVLSGHTNHDLPPSADMDFASPWGLQFTQNMRQLCRQYNVTYLHVNGQVLQESCLSPAHDHPVLHALGAQLDMWQAFCDNLRELNAAVVIATGFTTPMPPELAEDYADLDTGAAQEESTSLACRAALQPGFALNAIAPCHEDNADALEYDLILAAASAGNLTLRGDLQQMTGAEAATLQKWVQWHEENRPWLAFTQTLSVQALESTSLKPRETSHQPKSAALSNNAITGLLHLRNAVQGRYGYLCLWNPSGQEQTTTVVFTPEDYFVRLNPESLHIVRLKDNIATKVIVHKGAITLENLTLSPHSWEIYELHEK